MSPYRQRSGSYQFGFDCPPKLSFHKRNPVFWSVIKTISPIILFTTAIWILTYGIYYCGLFATHMAGLVASGFGTEWFIGVIAIFSVIGVGGLAFVVLGFLFVACYEWCESIFREIEKK